MLIDICDQVCDRWRARMLVQVCRISYFLALLLSISLLTAHSFFGQNTDDIIKSQTPHTLLGFSLNGRCIWMDCRRGRKRRISRGRSWILRCLRGCVGFAFCWCWRSKIYSCWMDPVDVKRTDETTLRAHDFLI